jgi:hypothetical protein
MDAKELVENFEKMVKAYNQRQLSQNELTDYIFAKGQLAADIDKNGAIVYKGTLYVSDPQSPRYEVVTMPAHHLRTVE